MRVRKDKKFFITLPFYDSSKVEIFSLEGRKLKTLQLNNKGSQTIDANFKSGIYFVRLVQSKHSFVTKVYIH